MKSDGVRYNFSAKNGNKKQKKILFITNFVNLYTTISKFPKSFRNKMASSTPQKGGYKAKTPRKRLICV